MGGEHPVACAVAGQRESPFGWQNLQGQHHARPLHDRGSSSGTARYARLFACRLARCGRCGTISYVGSFVPLIRMRCCATLEKRSDAGSFVTKPQFQAFFRFFFTTSTYWRWVIDRYLPAYLLENASSEAGLYLSCGAQRK